MGDEKIEMRSSTMEHPIESFDFDHDEGLASVRDLEKFF